VKSALARPWSPPVSAFAGFQLPPDIILLAVRWYLRYNLSYRAVEELLVERGVHVDVLVSTHREGLGARTTGGMRRLA
jgi:hypothetical protein